MSCPTVVSCLAGGCMRWCYLTKLTMPPVPNAGLENSIPNGQQSTVYSAHGDLNIKLCPFYQSAYVSVFCGNQVHGSVYSTGSLGGCCFGNNQLQIFWKRMPSSPNAQKGKLHHMVAFKYGSSYSTTVHLPKVRIIEGTTFWAHISILYELHIHWKLCAWYCAFYNLHHLENSLVCAKKWGSLVLHKYVACWRPFPTHEQQQLGGNGLPKQLSEVLQVIKSRPSLQGPPLCTYVSFSIARFNDDWQSWAACLASDVWLNCCCCWMDCNTPNSAVWCKHKDRTYWSPL